MLDSRYLGEDNRRFYWIKPASVAVEGKRLSRYGSLYCQLLQCQSKESPSHDFAAELSSVERTSILPCML